MCSLLNEKIIQVVPDLGPKNDFPKNYLIIQAIEECDHFIQIYLIKSLTLKYSNRQKNQISVSLKYQSISQINFKI